MINPEVGKYRYSHLDKYGTTVAMDNDECGAIEKYRAEDFDRVLSPFSRDSRLKTLAPTQARYPQVRRYSYFQQHYYFRLLMTGGFIGQAS